MNLQELLQTTLAARSKRNPAYSLRALARDLGIGASTASEIINGKYAGSAQTISKVSVRLNLSRATVQCLQEALAGQGPSESPVVSEISRAQFSLVHEWYFLAILALMDQGLYVDEATRVATTLGISEENAAAAITALCDADLLRQDIDGRLTNDFKSTFVPDGTDPQRMTEFHWQILDLAKSALTTVPRAERHFETRFLCLNDDAFGEAQNVLLEAAQKIEALAQKYDGNGKVYNISWQLFPPRGDTSNMG